MIQATYGPDAESIASLRSLGYDAWFTGQFAKASLDTHLNYVNRMGPIGCVVCDRRYINATMESFWRQAIIGPDQLRQRTALALSEIFVLSSGGTPEEPASHMDVLTRNAFGNFRQLLEDVTRMPAMGIYLSYLRNMKEDPITGRTPDENYAREVMQLFSIGLWQLSDDGTRKKDASGNAIPSYGLPDVIGMARVMTGLSWGGPDTGIGRWNGWPDSAGNETARWDVPLQFYPDQHSTGAKTFLGLTIPGGGMPNGNADLKIALDALFNHPNVGPFIGSQLIKRFVTSNPSPAYVQRVARAFANNGSGVRGDMKAVIKAVLMDPEARDAANVAQPNWGKLREPMIRYANYMRAFHVVSASTIYAIWNLEDPVTSLGQNPFRAPSVFNWFRPDYAPPGDIANAGLTAPEFQITHETTLTGYVNFLNDMAERTTQRFSDGSPTFLIANYSAELALADRPDALLDRLNTLLMAGQMTAGTRANVKAALLVRDATSPQFRDYRVAAAIRLLMASPEFIVQK